MRAKANVKEIRALVAEHAFFAGLDPARLDLVSGCAALVAFPAGAVIAREGDPADAFFAIRAGRVAIEIHAAGAGPFVLQTAGEGEVIGWSWLFPPYEWTFDARAAEDVRAIRFDGACLRRKCEADPATGYDFMKRFARVFVGRLAAARLQLLDLYGSSSSSRGPR